MLRNSIDFQQNLPRKFPQNQPFFIKCFFGEVSPQNFRETPTKSAAFAANLSLKIPQNLTFFSHDLSEALPLEQKKNEQLALFHFRIVFLCHGCVIVLCDPMLLDTFFSLSELRGLPC